MAIVANHFVRLKALPKGVAKLPDCLRDRLAFQLPPRPPNKVVSDLPFEDASIEPEAQKVNGQVSNLLAGYE